MLKKELCSIFDTSKVVHLIIAILLPIKSDLHFKHRLQQLQPDLLWLQT